MLASLSFVYHQWTKRQDDRLKVEQLDIEIALRLQDMNLLANLPDRNRYDNIENIQRVDDGQIQELKHGEVRDLFWVRRPTFPEYKDKNTTSLMWQLYLLVPGRERPEIQRAIEQSIQIDRLVPQIRLKAAIEPNPQNELKNDFGQDTLFISVSQLAKFSRWQNVFPATAK